MSIDFIDHWKISHHWNSMKGHDCWRVEMSKFACVDPDGTPHTERSFEGENARAEALAYLLTFLAPMPSKKDMEWLNQPDPSEMFDDALEPDLEDENGDQYMVERSEVAS
jgi:hypothetical protein